jgi:tetratricopeptide (TPR) repeat protein
MRSDRIVLALLVILLVIVSCSGCTGNNEQRNPRITPTTVNIYIPNKAAVNLFNKGWDNYIQHNYTAALDFFNQSISADPKYIQAWRERGTVLVKLNRTTEAINSYDSALALDKDLYMVWTSRGEALMSLGKYSEALDSFDKALKIAPEYNIAIEDRNLTLAKLK